MKAIYKILIGVLVFFSLSNGTFANENNNENTEEAPKTTIQTTVNKYILQVYKLQWDKILDELDANLSKVATTKESKIEAYSSIQHTLKLKKQATEKDEKMNKTTKNLLIKYLDYIIWELEAKKKKI